MSQLSRASAPAGDTRAPATRGVLVVLDDDPLMQFWNLEIDEFVAMLRNRAGLGPVEVRDTTDGDFDASVVFLVTHGGSAAWISGRVGRSLAAWATRSLVAVVQLLPQQHWRYQGMQAVEVDWMPGSSDTPTAQADWEIAGLDLRSDEELADDSTIAVPVLERGEDWFGRWSRLLDASDDRVVHLRALLLPRDGVLPPARIRYADDPVSRFRATASPTAFNLATRLAATPLNARMIRAVMRTVVRAGPAHLTEVLTSDLVRPVVHGREGANPANRILYDFLPDVRERLLAHGYRDRTIEVQHVVEQELAHDVEAVRALVRRVRAPHQAAYQRVTPAAEPYLRVELAVHLSLGGPNLSAAERLGRALGSPVPHQRRTRHQPGFTGSSLESGMSDTIPASGAINPLEERRSPGDDVASLLGGSSVSATLTGSEVERLREQRSSSLIDNRPQRNDNFTGRTELLEMLHNRLRTGTIAVLPESVHGSGGVGKSQLVLEYVYRFERDFNLIWWIPAERPAQIRAALTELAARLGLPVQGTANTAVPAVLEALRRGRPHTNWLLVFDNAENPEEVKRFFPTGGPGSIVITSRNGAWDESSRSLLVNVFDRRESVDLLSRRGPVMEPSDADRLAQALGDLPLALEQAAAWRAATGRSVEDYLGELNAYLRRLDESGEVQTEYPNIVAATWNVTLDLLRETDPSALYLLQICAFFAPEPIGRALLSKSQLRIHPELDRLLGNQTRLGQTIRRLGRLSLVRIDHKKNSFQMHRLVQRVLENQMDDETRDLMRHGAHLLLAGNDPAQPDEAEHWGRYAELFPHIEASGAERCLDANVREMVLNEAKYLWRWGDHVGAQKLSQLAYDAWIEIGAEADPDSLRMAAWLGFMHFVVGDYAAARELNARTLAFYEELPGDDLEETLNALGAVAADHRVRGDFGKALERSLTVYEQAVGNFEPDEPFTLRAAHNLAVSMRLSGLYGRALQLDQQTYARWVQIYGTHHMDSLNTFGGMNLDRRELGDYVAAHRSQEKVVATAREILRYDDHADLLRQSHMLASFRRKAGLHHEALELSSDVQTRFRSRYGDRHPDTVLATLTVSIDQRVTGDLRTARRTGEEAVEGMRALYGPEHPHTAGAEVDLAVTLRLLGESQRAKALNESAVRRLSERLTESHALVLAARLNLASDHYELGAYTVAYELDKASAERCREQLGESHPTTLAARINLALDLRGLGREVEAATEFEPTLEHFRISLGEDHPAIAAARAGVRANCDIDPLPL